MVSKVCLLVLVAFVAFQGISAEILTREEFEIQQRGLLQQAEAIIKKLLDLVNSTVTNTIVKLKDILDTIFSFGSEQVDNSSSIFLGVMSNGLTQIKELKDKAAALGIDTTECVGNKEQLIKDMPTAAIKDIQACVDNKVDIVQTIVNLAIDEVNTIVNVVNVLGAELKQCGGLNLFCYSKVIGEATLELAQVPLKAVKIITDTVNKVASVKGQIILCTTSQVETTVKTITGLTTEVITCLNKAIADKQATSVAPSY